MNYIKFTVDGDTWITVRVIRRGGRFVATSDNCKVTGSNRRLTGFRCFVKELCTRRYVIRILKEQLGGILDIMDEAA